MNETTRLLKRGWGLTGLIAVPLACVVVAAILVGYVALPPPFNLPPELIVLGIVLALVTPLLVTRWRTTFWILLAWLMIEDVIRKYLGNDLRVYFLKDGLFILLLFGLVFDEKIIGSWRAATGPVRFWLYAMIAWTGVLAVPMIFVNWQIPFVGLKLTWEYVPMVAAAFVLARESDGVRRLLTGIVALGIPACCIGIIQAYIGPTFLRPEGPTPFLQLNFTRQFDVVQPSGLFVSPGRFANMALIVFTAAFALLVLTYRASSWRFRVFAIVGVMVGGIAVWAEASKTAIIVAALLSVVAAMAPAFAERRPAMLRGVMTIGLVLTALLLVFLVSPQLSTSRVQYFTATLDPTQHSNEWSDRVATWEENTWRGLSIGGLMGAGTGTGSLGIQYVAGSIDVQSFTGVDAVEGGFAAVAQQWGVIGLVLWLVWSLSWVTRATRSMLAARGSQLSAAGLLLVSWMVYFLFVGFIEGFQSFQDYFASTYFWIFSGVVFALPWAARAADDRVTEG